MNLKYLLYLSKLLFAKCLKPVDKNRFYQILKIGETVAVEFKRCGGHIDNDVYETVCSFSNRFGGDIFLGVTDRGVVEGVPENAAAEMIKNFIAVVSNPALFSPTLYLDPDIMKYNNKEIIHIHVPSGGDVCTFKKVIYDRVNDADVKVTSTVQIAQMYIRKQEIYTERKVFPYLKKEDLRLDLLPKLRIMAVNNAGGNHPWKDMDDDELFKSSRLYIEDPVTGKSGFNLAAAMLLGKDETVLNVCPAYVTDAILRKVNVDRYDDRDFIQSNLVESYSRLFDFAKKHLPDKFYVEDLERKSLRNIIVREMIGNTLMHREFSSAYQAKFVIEKERMYTENANRTKKEGFITPKNFEPYPKNPIIASFFRAIGFADQLGSGVRKIFKYTKLYSGENPVFAESDIFRITVPLNELYSFDLLAPDKQENIDVKSSEDKSDPLNDPIKLNFDPINSESDPINDPINELLDLIKIDPYKIYEEYARCLKISNSTVKRMLATLRQQGIIKREGAKKTGHWVVINDPIKSESDPLNDPINIGGQTGGQTSGQTSGQTGGQRFSDTAEKILDYIRQNKFITRSDLSEKLKINPSAVQKHLENLKKSGVLKRVGGDFGGHWEIIDVRRRSEDASG